MVNVLKLELTARKAQQLIEKILDSDQSRVVLVGHCKQRMRERGIFMQDILRCLRHGSFIEGPCRDVKGNWKFTKRSVTSGSLVNVAAALDCDDQGNYIVVITVFGA
ncbi:MAG: DUF4258 domain-containing protein [Gammaproteobacteria bacterium]|nr:DUF4258 domain-containing protein [Gammaproteobacteria bacterium]MBU1655796.1 DUF4258 domain-containing protein [Gammaproteobacteria bacterium]MBU1960051.1 DUF4258 domain-containing protein [Gammaproteobacteria bacterium]